MKHKIAVGFFTIKAFLLDPHNLKLWTAHRTIYKKAGNFFEIRIFNGNLIDVELSITYNPADERIGFVNFDWHPGNSVRFKLEAIGQSEVTIEPLLPEFIPPAQKAKILHILAIELEVLKLLLEDGLEAEIPSAHLFEIQKYHLSLYNPQ